MNHISDIKRKGTYMHVHTSNDVNYISAKKHKYEIITKLKAKSMIKDGVQHLSVTK